MVVITGYYANLTRSVKTETMARGTRGPVCGNQWSSPQSSMKKGPSLHSWRRPGGWKSHAWHRVPFSRTCATSPFRASCSKLLLLICCWRVHRDWFKRCFFVKQPLHKDTKFEWQPYWRTGRPFFLLLQAPEHISIHVTLLSTTWCFCYGLCHCVWRNAI